MRATRKEYMTIEELITFMGEELKGCPAGAFTDRALYEMRVAMEKRPFFRPEKFKTWFVEKGVVYKNSPLSFLTKCGIDDIEKGLFDKEQIKGFLIHPLCEDMRARGITYTTEDTVALDMYFTYIYNNELMSLDDICLWVKHALDYIQKNSKSASEFKELLKKSKSTRKLNLPYLELDNEVAKACQQWQETLNKIKWDGNPLESETNYEKETYEINNPSTQTC